MNYRALQPPAELQAPLVQETTPSIEADSTVVAESRDDEVPQVYNEVLAMVQPIRPEPAQEMSNRAVNVFVARALDEASTAEAFGYGGGIYVASVVPKECK